jgi:bifunctional DNA-binding transcriptional regulator/antitoxin component of YhaV-PrlF toxin-antitoxin module
MVVELEGGWNLEEPVVLAQDGGTVRGMTERFVTFRTDAKGRTVIPAALRALAGIKEDGDVLVGHVEEGRLIVETRAAIKRRLQSQAATTGASGVVEQLLADRRADTDQGEAVAPAAEG